MAIQKYEELISKFGPLPDDPTQCKLLLSKYNQIENKIQNTASTATPSEIKHLVVEIVAVIQRMQQLHCPLP